MDPINCPHCRKPMARSLDGSGRWTCLPCNKRWEPDELANARVASAGMAGLQDEINKLTAIFEGRGR